MDLVNIHFNTGEPSFQAVSPEPEVQPAPAPAQEVRLRLRQTTVSPLEEFALRAGETQPISDALAALICSRKGRAEVSAKGITITRNDIGGKRTYHHPDSPLCNDLSQKERKFFYVLNSQRPDIIHILDENGRYLESLPEKFEPGVLNNEEQAKEHADQKRQWNRVAARMQELHKDDTAQAIADLQANNKIAQRIVQTMPSRSGATSSAGQPESSTEPLRSELGDRIQAGEKTLAATRREQVSAINKRTSATRLGDALRATRTERQPVEEDFSDADQWPANASDRNHHPAAAADDGYDEW